MTTTPPPRATFRPHERIRDPEVFRKAFERRKSVSDSVLIVYASENDLDHPRLGISIGRKRVRRATERNRVKRLVREAFRLARSELPAGVDLIVVPRGAGLSYAQVRSSLPRLARDAARRLRPRRPVATPPPGETTDPPEKGQGPG